jgi:hypothetical protein
MRPMDAARDESAGSKARARWRFPQAGAAWDEAEPPGTAAGGPSSPGGTHGDPPSSGRPPRRPRALALGRVPRRWPPGRRPSPTPPSRREAYRELFLFEIDPGLVDRIRTATKGGSSSERNGFRRRSPRRWVGAPGGAVPGGLPRPTTGRGGGRSRVEGARCCRTSERDCINK